MEKEVYEKMYHELFRSITAAIELLQEAQINAEELFMAEGDGQDT